tara:strand:+ start:188 stop:478 length:291 start_codon:yes stop_codon:yes gene_type:complete
MIGVIANIKIKDNKEEDFEKVATLLVDAVNAKEKENIYYRLYKKSENIYVMLEGYESRSSLDYHTKTEHYKNFGKKMAEFMDGPPEVIIMDQVAPK